MTGSCAPRRWKIAIDVGGWDSRYKKLIIICWRRVWRLSAMETKVDGCHAVGIDQNHAGVSLLESVCQSQSRVIDGNPQTWRQEYWCVFTSLCRVICSLTVSLNLLRWLKFWHDLQLKKACAIIWVVGTVDSIDEVDVSVRERYVVLCHWKSVTFWSQLPGHWHGVVPGSTSLQSGAVSSYQPRKHFPGTDTSRFAWEVQSARWKRVSEGKYTFSQEDVSETCDRLNCGMGIHTTVSWSEIITLLVRPGYQNT